LAAAGGWRLSPSILRRSFGLGLAALLAAGALWAVPAPPRAADDVDLRRIALSSDAASARRASGESVALTLDPALQRSAERLLARARPVEAGAMLVDAQSGQVLAFADLPRGEVLLRKKVPAASVFKLVTTAALLEHGHVSPKQRVCIDGGIRSIERKHLERPRSGVAICTAFRGALGHSRNAVYAQLVTRHLMRSDLLEMGERFGFNRLVPFDAARVSTGTLEVPFNDLEFARTSAGFRGSKLGVIGALELAAIVANGGQTLPLSILRASTERQPATRAIEATTAAELRRMMEVTVHSGTSLEAFSERPGKPYLPGIRVAGKTGTLQPGASDPTTSWFVGFAPSQKPEVVVSVLVQNGPVWRQRANEVARDLLRAYFAAKGRPGVTDPFAQ
jgi:penicillin-binding protein A